MNARSSNLAALRGRICALVLAFAAAAAGAAELPVPSGRIILSVTGAIGVTNAPGRADFDLEMLEALGTTDLSTSTAWTDGTPTFTGVLGRTLIAALEARGTVAESRAINDYRVEIPLADFDRYDVLLATRIDGRTMRVREKGPIWVVYPWDAHPELADEQTKQKSIWQLRSIHIR